MRDRRLKDPIRSRAGNQRNGFFRLLPCLNHRKDTIGIVNTSGPRATTGHLEVLPTGECREAVWDEA